MVLVPGLDGTALLFYRQVPSLSTRFRVETFPLRDDPSCTMEGLVADLKGMWRHLRLPESLKVWRP